MEHPEDCFHFTLVQAIPQSLQLGQEFLAGGGFDFQQQFLLFKKIIVFHLNSLGQFQSFGKPLKLFTELTQFRIALTVQQLFELTVNYRALQVMVFQK